MQRPSRHEGSRAAGFLTSRVDYERTSIIPYGQRDFHLDRMRQLLARLGNPQDALKIVHVAGTKGKGSTAATMASILRAAGYRTGLYSSPHLDRVEERLAIEGAACPADELEDLVQRIQPVVAAMDSAPSEMPGGSNRPTYFEIITALALLRFAEHRVDAAVLEVGMGGRLDSTNVCQPLASVITSISFDHTQQLGNTLAAIAGEKAGIIKHAVPVISGVSDGDAREVVASVARDHDCRLLQWKDDFDFAYRPPQKLEQAPSRGRMDFHCRTAGLEAHFSDLELNLAGEHQAANAAVALTTLLELRRQGWRIPDAAIRRGLVDVCWPARIEVISRGPTIVLDAAHNRASVQALVDVLGQSFSPSPRTAVFGTTRDKDLRGMLSVLLPGFDRVVFTQYESNPRAAKPEDLDALAAEISPIERHICRTPAAAWEFVRRTASPSHLICITGSFFLAAEMRALIRQTEI
jgi:dihydrofolate synthase / folylpolyglutamate synthase